MPHIIPSSNRDKHVPDMGCVCEPEIHFSNKCMIIIHKNEDDQIAVDLVPDPFHDKPTGKDPEY